MATDTFTVNLLFPADRVTSESSCIAIAEPHYVGQTDFKTRPVGYSTLHLQSIVFTSVMSVGIPHAGNMILISNMLRSGSPPTFLPDTDTLYSLTCKSL